MDATALPPPGHWTGVEQLEFWDVVGLCFLDPSTKTFRFREGLWVPALIDEPGFMAWGISPRKNNKSVDKLRSCEVWSGTPVGCAMEGSISVRPFPILSMTQSLDQPDIYLDHFGSAKVLSPEDLLFKVQKSSKHDQLQGSPNQWCITSSPPANWATRAIASSRVQQLPNAAGAHKCSSSAWDFARDLPSMISFAKAGSSLYTTNTDMELANNNNDVAIKKCDLGFNNCDSTDLTRKMSFDPCTV